MCHVQPRQRNHPAAKKIKVAGMRHLSHGAPSAARLLRKAARSCGRNETYLWCRRAGFLVVVRPFFSVPLAPHPPPPCPPCLLYPGLVLFSSVAVQCVYQPPSRPAAAV